MQCERPTIDALGSSLGQPCLTPAVFDVVYQLATEHEPRGVRLCLGHYQELAELKARDMVTSWDARSIRG